MNILAAGRAYNTIRNKWFLINMNMYDGDIEMSARYAKEMADIEFASDLAVAQRLSQSAKQSFESVRDRENGYFITIRPPNTTNFSDFKNKIAIMMKRKCFKSYSLSFEQKGTYDRDLGQGAHVHIGAVMTQVTKGQVIRDLHSSLKDLLEAHAIDVSPCSEPDVIFEQYCVQYQSKDGHKVKTQDSDTQWRLMNGLKSVYTGPDDWP